MGEIPEESLPQEDREGLIDLQDYSYPEVFIEEDPVVEQLQDDIPAMEHRDKSKGILLYTNRFVLEVQRSIVCCVLTVHTLIKAERFALVCELCMDQLSDEERSLPLGTCGDKTHIKVKKCNCCMLYLELQLLLCDKLM